MASKEKWNWETNPDAALTEARRRINSARQRNGKELVLSELGALKVIPPEIAWLTGLQALYFSTTQVVDLTPLSGLFRLQTLSFRDTLISDLSPLGGLTSLKYLDFSRTPVADLAPLAGLTELQRLNFSSTRIADLTPLVGLTRLQDLSFAGTSVADLTPLTDLTNLQILNFSQTQVADLTPLAGLTELQRLYFSDTQVTDPVLIELSQAFSYSSGVSKVLIYLREQVKKREEEKTTNPPSVPSQSIAPLKFGYEGDVLKALSPHGVPAASDAARNRTLEAYEALKEMAEEIRQNMAGGNYPRVSQALAAYSRALGSDFEHFRQIALGIVAERLREQAAVAQSNMPDDLAADLKGVMAAHALFAQLFTEWQEFLSDLGKNNIDPAQAEAAKPAAHAIIEEFKQSPNIDPGVSKELDELEENLADGGAQSQEISQGYYRSLGNALISLATRARDEANKLTREAKANFRTEVAKKVAWSPFVVLWDVLNGSPYLTQLATHLPDVVPWLQAFIDWWKHLPRQ